MIHTTLCDLVGIRYPIFQGGMAWVATWQLASAVSEAGGLGIIGAGSAPATWVREQIHQMRLHTAKSFGVNVPLFNSFADEVIAVCIEERVPVMTTGAGNPIPYIEPLKNAGVVVIPVVASTALARRLERAGADGLIAEGEESGGHIGTVTTMALVPQVVDVVSIPVVAAGGMADGRGLAAALALGAAGVQMGTRFICTIECIAHEAYKQAIVRANERSTMVTGASLGHPVRGLRNQCSLGFEELERRNAPEEEIVAFGTGRLRAAAIDGDVTNGALMAGQSAGLVSDILPAAEVISRIMSQAETSINAVAHLVGQEKVE